MLFRKISKQSLNFTKWCINAKVQNILQINYVLILLQHHFKLLATTFAREALCNKLMNEGNYIKKE